MRTVIWLAAALATGGALAGCAPQDAPAGSGARYMAGRFKAEAALKTPAGAAAGTASVQEENDALRVTVSVTGLPPGPHGAHLHMTGRCDAPDFASAGAHWNPTARQHGSLNPQGPHSGDLPNLTVGSDGRGTLSFRVPDATLAGLLDEDGAAMVVHAGEDDLRTDPSGNSGGRIACGVLAVPPNV